MRVVGYVPRHHLKVVAFHLFCECNHLVSFLNRRWFIGFDEVVEQFIYVLYGCCHAVFHHVIGVSIIAQELCHLSAKVDKTLTNLKVIRVIVLYAECVMRHIEFLTQLPPCAIHKERTVTGGIQGEHPTLHSAFFGSLLCCFTCGIRQSIKVFLVSNVQCIRLILLQKIL